MLYTYEFFTQCDFIVHSTIGCEKVDQRRYDYITGKQYGYTEFFWIYEQISGDCILFLPERQLTNQLIYANKFKASKTK